MTIGSLFSGIGGLELGLERAGLGPVSWQVEIDPYCRRVLARHWPQAVRYDDVRSVGRAALASVDVICGGFPCTDLSKAARGVARTGLNGEQSGLWREMRRIVAELEPQWVVVENVAAAWRDWLPVVRRDLWADGYASMSIRVRAADVGCPMGRARVFVVANADRYGERLRAIHAEVGRASQAIASRGEWADGISAAMGMDHGIPDRAHLRALGNAVVPQCAEVIGRAIVAAVT